MPLSKHDHYELEEGYVLRRKVGYLTYPSNVEFSHSGEIFVVEAGFTYPFIYSPARISRVKGDTTEVVAEGFHGPLIGLHWYEDGFFATHRGTLTRVGLDGRKHDLVTDLPAFGDHHTNHIAVTSEHVYFGQGTATNSGVVGTDNLLEYGWLLTHRKGCDMPPYDVVLSGVNFRSRDAFNPLRHVETGAFLPFGEASEPGQVIKGDPLRANGVIYRCRHDGSELEVYAWGLRNPYALSFDPDGRLLTIVQAEDNRGSRPFSETPDALFEVKQGAWYGWPDFCAGKPAQGFIAEARTESPTAPLLQSHPSAPEQPLHVFSPHSAAVAIDFSRSEDFGFSGHAFVAEFGSGAPLTTGGKMLSRGHKLVRLDMKTMQQHDFFVSHSLTGGPRRPVQARFSSDGRSLYVVDHGNMGIPKSGGLWEITRG